MSGFPRLGYPAGMIGATAPSRYVGGTVTGHPVTGTFRAGDFVIAQDGVEWLCTADGSPGTWAQFAGIVGAFLTVAGNLSDVANVTTARNNLNAQEAGTSVPMVNGIGHSIVNGDTTDTYENEAFGAGALSSLVTQNQDDGLGNYGGAYNTAFGYQALHNANAAPHLTASANSAFGLQALAALTTGIQNVGMGMQTLYSLTTGNNCTACGFNALYYNLASNMVAVGYAALFANTTGAACTAVGYQAGYHNTTGNNNTSAGDNALFGNIVGGANTAIGSSALTASTANFNTAVGAQAGAAVTTGGSNTFVGAQAGWDAGGSTANATILGSEIVAVGYNSGAGNATDPTGFVAIGFSAVCGGSYATAIGRAANASASGAVAIGVDNSGLAATSGTVNLIVLGTANHTTQIPGLPAFVAGDKYLVVDATGKIHKSALGPAS